jgi:hypothetical protein
LARSSLRTALSSNEIPVQEKRLLDDVKRRTDLWTEVGPYYASNDGAPKRTEQSRGTEAVLNALVLATHDAQTGQLSETTRFAFANLWETQLKLGPNAGSWPWLDFGLEPWEAPESQYFGAALALLAVNAAPEGYRSEPAIQKNVSSLNAYLMREYSRQSLLNRSALLWAAEDGPSVMDSQRRQAIVSDLVVAQRSDGGWGLATLIRGSFFADPHHYLHSWINGSGIVDQGSDGYATGLAIIALLRGGKPRQDPVIERAVSWLIRNQDPKGGFWPARSLNETRDPYSGVGHFMTDASTALASMALAEAAQSTDIRASSGRCTGLAASNVLSGCAKSAQQRREIFCLTEQSLPRE